MSMCMLILFGVSCSDKSNRATDVKVDGDSFFQYNGSTFELGTGFLIDYGTVSENSFNFDLILLGEGMQFDFDNDTGSGTGPILYFELFSESESTLASGRYTFSEVSENYGQAGTFSWAWMAQNVDLSDDDPDIEPNYFTGGTMDVERNGSNFEISFSGTMQSENQITGTFSGRLEIIEDDLVDGSYNRNSAIPLKVSTASE